MNIIFIGGTGVHQSLLAANLYLGRCTLEDYLSLSDLGNKDKEATGDPIYVGTDQMGNRVYSLGGGSDLSMVEKSINQLTEVLGFSKKDMVAKPVYIKGAPILLILYRFSRFSWLNHLVRPIILFILQKEFENIASMVLQFRSELEAI